MKLLPTLTALTAAPLLTSAACPRATLIEATQRYIAAQSLGELRIIHALTPNTTYIENASPANISTGILSKKLKIDKHRSIHDTTQCATYTEIIVTDPVQYVIGTQLYFTVTGNSTVIKKIDSIVTDKDDWLFNAQHTLYYALQESWDYIPTGKQDNRSTIQAAADAYLDLFQKGPGSISVPWGENCRRLEGGMYTEPGSTCNSGVPTGINLVDRRYIIDETVGTVDVFLTFGGSKLPDSHEFRVEGGRIRYVHTITVCWENHCGFDKREQLSRDLGW